MPANAKQVPNAVVIEVTDNTEKKLITVFQLNKGLVLSEQTNYEATLGENIYIANILR